MNSRQNLWMLTQDAQASAVNVTCKSQHKCDLTQTLIPSNPKPQILKSLNPKSYAVMTAAMATENALAPNPWVSLESSLGPFGGFPKLGVPLWGSQKRGLQYWGGSILGSPLSWESAILGFSV